MAIGAESLSELRAARATLIAVAKLAHSCECLSDRDVIDIRNALRVARSPQRTPASVVASATSACEELSQVLSRRLPDDLDLRSALPAAGSGQPVASQSTSLINVASSSRRIRKNVRRCRLNAIPRANGAAGDFASNQVRSFLDRSRDGDTAECRYGWKRKIRTRHLLEGRSVTGGTADV